jgi:amino acid transporter
MATAVVEERELLKAMSWWDGFVVALSNPGFLFAALGGSIGALGTVGAAVFWLVSVLLGAFQNNIYAELSAMFPGKAGGIAVYAHEAWKRYFTLVGPLATFGYWFAWSSVLAISGLIAGTLIQAEFFSDVTWSASGAGFDLNLPILIGVALLVLVWYVNTRGIRATVAFSYITGGALLIPAAVLMFGPYITGDMASANLNWDVGANGGLALALTWLYFMGWSAYGFESVAVFAPEYRDTEHDVPRALRASALFSVLVYALLPLGAGGTLGTKAIAGDATAITFYKDAFDAIGGSFIGGVLVICLAFGLVLTMSTATLDGSRALYGIAKSGMTVKQLGVLNEHHVPGRGMALDAILNIFLVTYLGTALAILAAGNLGYMMAHVFALSGFLLLRRDRPDLHRPIKLSRIWVPIAAFLALANLVFVIAGGFVFADKYGYGLSKTFIGLIVLAVSVLLYVYRRKVQDRLPLQLRDRGPITPVEAGQVGVAGVKAEA